MSFLEGAKLTHRIGGNTAGATANISTGTYLLAGGNNITLSQNANTVTISAGAGVAGSNTAGMSNLGNTSGTTGVVSGSAVRYLYAGGNNVTLSQSLDGVSATLTISAFNQSAESQSVGMSNIGNTSGDTGIASGAQVRYVLAGGNNVTLSQSLDGASATVTISAFSQSVRSLDYWANMRPTPVASDAAALRFTVSTAARSLWVFPLTPNDIFPGNLTCNSFMIAHSATNNTATNATSCTYTLSIGLYTEVNATRLSLLNSASTSWQGTSSASWTRFFGGQRWITIHSSVWSVQPTFSQTRYYMGYWLSTAGQTYSYSHIGMHAVPQVGMNQAEVHSGTIQNSATAATLKWIPLMGRYSATTSALPSAIGASELSMSRGDSNDMFIPSIVLDNRFGTIA